MADEHAEVDTILPWLRVSLGEQDTVLDHRQVEALWDALGEWLDRQAARKDGET